MDSVLQNHIVQKEEDFSLGGCKILGVQVFSLVCLG